MLGTNGQLGSSFIQYFVKDGFINLNKEQVSNSCLVNIAQKEMTKLYPPIDISNKQKVANLVFDSKPDIVINCCASTDVDKIESSPLKGILSNVIGVQNINEVCRNLDIKQIFFSTEAAYDGAKKNQYIETDQENPQSKYALTKIIGDHLVLNSHSQSWIFRTSWLYSTNSKSSFVTRILEKSNTTFSSFGVTDDIFGNPTPAWWLTETVIGVLRNLENLPTGLYHLCSSQVVSKYEWAKRIMTDLNPEKVSLIIPSKRKEYPNAGLRSPYVDLSTKKIQHYLEKSLPSWEELWHKSVQ